MFEIALSQSHVLQQLLSLYIPGYERLFVRFPLGLVNLTLLMLDQSDKVTRAVHQGRETISRVANRLIQEKKQKIQEDKESGRTHSGRDLLSLLRMFLFAIFFVLSF